MKCSECGDEMEFNPEAEAEYAAAFPEAYQSEAKRKIVCDDCYAEFLKWYAALAVDEIARMEKERREEEDN